MSHFIHFTLPPAETLNLAQTLDCGQAFRFSPLPDGRWQGVAGNRSCIVGLSENVLTIECSCGGDCAVFWARYFDLERDYCSLHTLFSTDPILRRAISYCPGIRLLRQDGWETLCSFIISQNNNIPRIKGILQRLCMAFGDPLPDGQHAFPSARTLAGLPLEALDILRAGFRAKYLLDAAQKVTSGEVELEALFTLPLDEARELLKRIRGVGPKVAECVLLFGFSRTECFPQDVWIKRAMEQLYPDGLPEAFLPYAGIAQQYLFHYCRTCPGALAPAPAGTAASSLP